MERATLLSSARGVKRKAKARAKQAFLHSRMDGVRRPMATIGSQRAREKEKARADKPRVHTMLNGKVTMNGVDGTIGWAQGLLG